MMSSLSIWIVGQVTLAAIVATVIATLALALRLAVVRDAVVRYRIGTALVPAVLLLLPAQFAARQWAPPWSEWIRSSESASVAWINDRAGSLVGVYASYATPAAATQQYFLNVSAAEVTASDSSPSRVAWQTWLGATYFLGCGALAFNWLWRASRVVQIMRRCRPVTSRQVLIVWREIASSRGVKPHVRLMQSDDLDVPACLGGLRPAIIIPARDAQPHSTDQLSFALRHECEHLRRSDWMTSAMQSLMVLTFWFHPLIWRWSRTIDRDREASCDALVVRATRQPHSYAMALLAYCAGGSKAVRIAPAPLAGFGSNATLLRRLHMIIHAEHSLNRTNRVGLLAGTFILACAAVFAQFTFAAAAQNQSSEAPDQKGVEIKTVSQESGVIKRAQIEAPPDERDPAVLIQQLEDAGHRVAGGWLTNQETIASAWKATVDKNIIMAHEFNLSLPEGSKLEALISGDRISIRRDGAKSRIAIANGRIELVDDTGVRRVLLRPVPETAKLELSATIEHGEVSFVATSPDKSAKLRLEFDRTTGIPEDEDQPPHGAVRYQLFPADEVEENPTRFKMQWIYDVGKVRAQLNNQDR